MNARTSRLIRKLSIKDGTRSRPLKRIWNALPRNQRHGARLLYQAFICDPTLPSMGKP